MRGGINAIRMFRGLLASFIQERNKDEKGIEEETGCLAVISIYSYTNAGG